MRIFVRGHTPGLTAITKPEQIQAKSVKKAQKKFIKASENRIKIISPFLYPDLSENRKSVYNGFVQIYVRKAEEGVADTIKYIYFGTGSQAESMEHSPLVYPYIHKRRSQHL